MSGDAADADIGHFARTLDGLIRPRPRPDGRAGVMSNEQVAEEVNALAGRDVVSGTYVWQLRTGRRRNPSLEAITALADYFKVSPSDFLDDKARQLGDEELRLITALQDAGVSELAARAVGLSPKTLQSILTMVDHARQLENLSDDPPVLSRPIQWGATVQRRVSSAGHVTVEGPRSGQILELGVKHAGAEVKLQVDDRRVRVVLPDGTRRTFVRHGNDPVQPGRSPKR